MDIYETAQKSEFVGDVLEDLSTVNFSMLSTFYNDQTLRDIIITDAAVKILFFKIIFLDIEIKIFLYYYLN